MKLPPFSVFVCLSFFGFLHHDCLAAEDISLEANRHLIVVDSEGLLRNPVIKRSPATFGNGQKYSIDLPLFKAPNQGQPPGEEQYLDRIIDGIRASHKKRVLIIIHGGMNFVKSAVERGAELSSLIQAQSPYYPIFVCWDSNPISTYGDNLLNVRNGESQRQLRGRYYAWLTSPFYLAADLGRAGTAAPAVFSQQAVNDLHATAPGIFDDSRAVFARINYADPKTRNVPLIHPVAGIDVSVGANRKGPLENTARAISYWALLPTRIVTAPIIDALGKSAWENMNRRISAMLRPQTEFLDDPHQQAEGTGSKMRNGVAVVPNGAYQPPTGGLAVFMQRLDHFYNQEPAGKDIKTTLIGHSMGAIVINQMLHYCNDNTGEREVANTRKGHASHLKLRIEHIVYMAAACTTEDFSYTVLPYLETHKKTDFYNLTLHPLADYREIAMPGDLIPRGSLLAWIDTFFGNPRTSFNRTYGKFDNAILATQILPQPVRDRIHIKGFSVGQMAQPRDPQHHGAFLDAPSATNGEKQFWNKDQFWTTWTQ